jgi:hypothetical protein
VKGSRFVKFLAERDKDQLKCVVQNILKLKFIILKKKKPEHELESDDNRTITTVEWLSNKCPLFLQ